METGVRGATGGRLRTPQPLRKQIPKATSRPALAACVVMGSSSQLPREEGRCPADVGLSCAFLCPCSQGFSESGGGVEFLERGSSSSYTDSHSEILGNLDKGLLSSSKSVELSVLHLLTLTLDVLETETNTRISPKNPHV